MTATVVPAPVMAEWAEAASSWFTSCAYALHASSCRGSSHSKYVERGLGRDITSHSPRESRFSSQLHAPDPEKFARTLVNISSRPPFMHARRRDRRLGLPMRPD